MHLKHFGDSYDIVKQSLLQWLARFGPWAVHPMFTHPVTQAEAEAFSRFLGAPLVSTGVLGADSDRQAYLAVGGDCRSVFLDPTTGVRLRHCGGRGSPDFIFGDELVAIASARPQGLVLTFDQSLARGNEMQQIRDKLAHLAEQKVQGFAYVSHASFMVLGQSEALVREAKVVLAAESCLPEHRIISGAA